MPRSSAIRVVVVGALLAGLTACGSGSGSGVDQAAGSTSADSTDAIRSAPGTPADADGSHPTADVSKSLCQFLEKEVPDLESKGPGGTGAAGLANFTLAYSGWVDEDPDHKLKDAAEIDTITTASCPKERAAILAVLESPSFAAAFGG